MTQQQAQLPEIEFTEAELNEFESSSTWQKMKEIIRRRRDVFWMNYFDGEAETEVEFQSCKAARAELLFIMNLPNLLLENLTNQPKDERIDL